MAHHPRHRPSQSDLPHLARLAWTLRDTELGDVDRGLNAGKVVRAAIALADEEGLNGLSIRQLGQRLGFATMAVYRHVRSRDELLVLMVDVALGPPPDSVSEASIWQDAVRSWGCSLFARYQAHPWLLDVPALGLPTTPNHVDWLEVFLAKAAPPGLALPHQLDAALLVDGHARYSAHQLRLGRERAVDATEVPPTVWLPSLVDRATHPHFADALASGVLSDDTGPDFEFGLNCIIDGLATRSNP
jgi:AcrR family transcriptional regulator